MLSDVKLFNIPIREDEFGSLGVLEFSSLEFIVKRLYWLSSVPAGQSRGNHAHKALTQLFFLVSGSVTIELHLGREIQKYSLVQSGQGLLIPPGMWRTLFDFSHDAVLMVLCDQTYDESDYIRNHDDYLEWFEG